MPGSISDLLGCLEGGHAVMAVGYDDKMVITNKFSKEKTTGTLLIRNSWRTSWGDNGYGWLPYDYVLRGLAEDFWSILKKEWVDTGAFLGRQIYVTINKIKFNTLEK